MATKRMSSISLSRSARAVPSDRTGLYMLKKHSGTRNENAWASIAKRDVERFSAGSGTDHTTKRIRECGITDERTHPKS